MKFQIKHDEPSVNRTLRFPSSLLAHANEVAQNNHISFNQLVIQALEYALKNLETAKPGKAASEILGTRRSKGPGTGI